MLWEQMYVIGFFKKKVNMVQGQQNGPLKKSSFSQ